MSYYTEAEKNISTTTRSGCIRVFDHGHPRPPPPTAGRAIGDVALGCAVPLPYISMAMQSPASISMLYFPRANCC